MKQFLFISLMLVFGSASGQELPTPVLETLDIKYSDTARTDTVMLKIILSNKTSVHFYRKGLKRGDQYWYFDGRRIKKLPGNWFVWETRPIKK